MLYNAYAFSGPTNPNIRAGNTVPPILPPTMCTARCGSSTVQPLPNPNGAGPMPSPIGGPGQPANTLAGGVTARPGLAAMAAPTAPGSNVRSIGGPVTVGGCAGCSGARSLDNAPWWAWLLIGIGALAILKRVTS